ncbi:hypothetical protein ISN39_12345 [Rhizobium sp. 007]|nr:hypothetical protein [Rhizobium sp. 007]QPB18468.1 hypothetical protein ISN39_12345 [Rhizobium sp. 007]
MATQRYRLMAQRYSLHRNLNVYWTVFDVVTGQPVVIDGMIMDMLTDEEAYDLVNRLNRENGQERPFRVNPEDEP